MDEHEELCQRHARQRSHALNKYHQAFSALGSKNYDLAAEAFMDALDFQTAARETLQEIGKLNREKHPRG